MTARFSKPGQWGHGIAEMRGGDHRWTGRVELDESKLLLPLRWRKPRCIFVNSTSDLFHERLSVAAIHAVFSVMERCPRHVFIALTKRAERMRSYCYAMRPLPNVVLGVSVEDQATADERIPHLLATPAACRMVSAEPLLGSVDFSQWIRGLGWIVSGGESGPCARPMHPDWPRAIRDHCQLAGAPFFFKQWGEWAPATLAWQPHPFGIFPDGRYYRGGLLMGPINKEAIDIAKLHSGQEYVRIHRVGKRRAGRLLDGREWTEFPEVGR